MIRKKIRVLLFGAAGSEKKYVVFWPRKNYVLLFHNFPCEKNYVLLFGDNGLRKKVRSFFGLEKKLRLFIWHPSAKKRYVMAPAGCAPCEKKHVVLFGLEKLRLFIWHRPAKKRYVMAPAGCAQCEK